MEGGQGPQGTLGPNQGSNSPRRRSFAACETESRYRSAKKLQGTTSGHKIVCHLKVAGSHPTGRTNLSLHNHSQLRSVATWVSV